MRARIRRAFRVATDATGAGYETSYQAEGTDFTTKFKAIGVKAPEQLEDDFLALFVWVWSLKDYLKAALKARGLPSNTVDQEVDGCPALTYVADIANRAKHGSLRKSRSGKFARLVDVGYEVPRDAIASIVVAGPDVTVGVKDPQSVFIHATVITSPDERMDALAVLNDAMHAWESKVIARIAANPAVNRTCR